MSIVNFLYNPDRKGKEQLISEFVVRNKILDDIMKDLERSDMKTPEQHYLLVGQRGSGKSTLLNRIKYAVEDSVKLSPTLIPILFGEEQYNVGELANLWENVAQVLEDYHGFDGLYEEMESHAYNEKFEEKCWDILEFALDMKGKKILLLIDNIGDMFKRIEELEVRRLRELLQTKSQICLIAGSPFYLESLLDYKQPLFEFFKVIRLDELSSVETSNLLLKLGEIHGEKDKIERIVKETPGRVESLRILTGGVPRTIALMFNIFIEHEHESSLKDLDRILDNVTPLYKHRMDDLPAQQQKIVDAVAKNWDPISVKDLKDKVRLVSKVISAQLRQLEKNQVVQKMETGTKNHEYILRERFFNIWYLMRYGRKDDKQRVVWLVRFLESWCTDEEIEKRVMSFIQQVKNQIIDDDMMNFFGEVYSSINRLTIETKILLLENTPQYKKNIILSRQEINKLISENLAQKKYAESLKLLSMHNQLKESDKSIVLDVIIQLLLEKQDLKKYSSSIANLIQEELGKGVMPFSGAFQLYVIFVIIIFYLQINNELNRGDYEKAVFTMKSQLTGITSMTKYLGNENYFWDFKIEIRIILLGIREFYLKGQFYAIEKIFENEAHGMENGTGLLSEVFNPIYLALISLNPEGKKFNIAPEKEAIVQQIRDYITAKK